MGLSHLRDASKPWRTGRNSNNSYARLLSTILFERSFRTATGDRRNFPPHCMSQGRIRWQIIFRFPEMARASSSASVPAPEEMLKFICDMS